MMQGVSSSSVCLGMDELFYCGSPCAFHINVGYSKNLIIMIRLILVDRKHRYKV